MPNKAADTQQPIHPLLAQRWSPVAFTPRQPSSETLTSLFEAARWAASAYNAQPWRFILATQADEVAFARMLNCLVPGNQTWAQTVPVLVAVVAKMTDYKGRPNSKALYDTGAAVAQLTLEALAQGLHVHQMGGIKADVVRETYGVPADYDPVVVIAIGYAAVGDEVADNLRERNSAERSRLPLADLVFSEEWAQSAQR